MKKKFFPESYIKRRASVGCIKDPTSTHATHPIFPDRKLGFVAVHRKTHEILATHTSFRKCQELGRVELYCKLSKEKGKMIGKKVFFEIYKNEYKHGQPTPLPTWAMGELKGVLFESYRWGTNTQYEIEFDGKLISASKILNGEGGQESLDLLNAYEKVLTEIEAGRNLAYENLSKYKDDLGFKHE